MASAWNAAAAPSQKGGQELLTCRSHRHSVLEPLHSQGLGRVQVTEPEAAGILCSLQTLGQFYTFYPTKASDIAVRFVFDERTLKGGPRDHQLPNWHYFLRLCFIKICDIYYPIGFILLDCPNLLCKLWEDAM